MRERRKEANAMNLGWWASRISKEKEDQKEKGYNKEEPQNQDKPTPTKVWFQEQQEKGRFHKISAANGNMVIGESDEDWSEVETVIETVSNKTRAKSSAAKSSSQGKNPETQ